jgi:hypothetical protein
VIIQLGDLKDINPGVIENLFSADLAYLQDLYGRINASGHTGAMVLCPHCEREFEVAEPLLNGGDGLGG